MKTNTETQELDSIIIAKSALAGKYLTFMLADEDYGLEILKIQEIIGMMNITSMPRTPDYVRGVINLRGKVIPVLDMRRKFDLPTTEDTNRTCIIVTQIDNGETVLTTGIVVDRVSEVLDIAATQIDPPPDFGGGIETRFILGLGKVNNRVIMLLDINSILTSDDMEIMQATVEE
jgi:purine-binding chemotaxis protein CheW